MTRSLKNLRILILGGTGFIGSALNRKLDEDGARVTIVSRRRPHAMYTGARSNWIGGDLRDESFVSAAVAEHDVVFHLASGSRPATANANPAADVAASVVPSLHLFRACALAGVRKIVFISSGGTVYGPAVASPIPETAALNPISAYGAGKAAIETYLGFYGRDLGLEYQVARLANPFGPGQVAKDGQGVVAAMIDRALRGSPIEIMGDGSAARDFVFIDDAVEALSLLVRYDGPYRTMNIGSGRPTKISQIANDIERILGVPRANRIFTPSRTFDVPVNYLSIERIMAETGWRPRTSWEDGLEKTIQSARMVTNR